MTASLTRPREQGFGLLEMLVAMAIGLLVSAAALSVYLSNKQSYRHQEANARLQENGRFVLNKIAYDVRMAGVMGCLNLAETTPKMHVVPSVPAAALPPGWSVDKSSAIRSFQVTGPISGFTNPTPGTEALTVLRTSTGVPLQTDMSDRAAPIDIGADHGFSAEDVLLISDCRSADVFQPSAVTEAGIAHANPPNADGRLSKAYRISEGTQVFRLQALTYYVSSDPAGDQFELRRRDLFKPGNADFAVVEGVEDVRYRFGVETGDGVVRRFADTNDPSLDPSNTVSVFVQLLLRTEADNLTDAPQTITFAGTSVNVGSGADRRLRRVFSGNVALRNRVARR